MSQLAGNPGGPGGRAEEPLRYAITDRTRFAGGEPERRAALLRNAVRWAALAAPERLDFVQLREKDLAARELAALARALLETLGPRESAPRLLINSRPDVAIAVAAAGVHLTSAPGELTPNQVRHLYAAASLPEPIISISCHTLAEVARAVSPEPGARASLILFGPVFEKVAVGGHINRHTDRHIDKPAAAGAGLDLLRSACSAAAPTPVLALGGVTAANSAACLAAGAAGIAAIRLFIMEQVQ